jgi:SAM-dependent methyltransferase
MGPAESTRSLLAAWAEDLSGWGIPDEILAKAPESPWGFPGRVFEERAQRQVAERAGLSYQRAEEALVSGGTVLDVGSGAGAACLPLATKASLVTAVDADPAMLSRLVDIAASMPGTHARVETVAGTWPEVSAQVGPADVVQCHHVLYNVGDLRPFVEALTTHARARVVVEVTERHPLEPMNRLWMRFHRLARPAGPSAEQAAAAIASLGLDVHTERWGTAPLHRYESFDEMVAFHRRRLCLPAGADPEVAAALEELGVDPANPVGLGAGRAMVTLWWAPA